MNTLFLKISPILILFLVILFEFFFYFNLFYLKNFFFLINLGYIQFLVVKQYYLALRYDYRGY